MWEVGDLLQGMVRQARNCEKRGDCRRIIRLTHTNEAQIGSANLHFLRGAAAKLEDVAGVWGIHVHSFRGACRKRGIRLKRRDFTLRLPSNLSEIIFLIPKYILILRPELKTISIPFPIRTNRSLS